MHDGKPTLFAAIQDVETVVSRTMTIYIYLEHVFQASKFDCTRILNKAAENSDLCAGVWIIGAKVEYLKVKNIDECAYTCNPTNHLLCE